MALADTVATCKLNLCDRFAIDAAKAAMSRENPAAPGGGGEPTPGEIRCFWLLKLLLNILHVFFLLLKHIQEIFICYLFFPYILWLKRSSSSSAIIQFLLFFCRILGRLWPSVLVGHETLHLLTTLPPPLTTGTAAATRTRILKHYLVKFTSFGYILFPLNILGCAKCLCWWVKYMPIT